MGEIKLQNNKILLNSSNNEIYFEEQTLNIPTNGLLYYYPMDSDNSSGGETYDIINNNTITFTSSLTFGTDHNSTTDGCIEGGYKGASLNNHGLELLDNISVSFWVYMKGSIYGILEFSALSDNFSCYTFSSNRFVCNINKKFLDAYDTGWNKWAHLTYTKEGTTWKSYLNSSYYETEIETGQTIIDSTIRIGTHQNAYTWATGNYMNDLLIYNRVLTQSEIEQIYNNT